MAEQQSSDIEQGCPSDSDSESQDEDCEPAIVRSDVTVIQPARVLVSVRDAKEEDIIKKSSLGPAVLAVIEQLLKADLQGFACEVVQELRSCVLSSKMEQSSKTVPLSRLWRNFHCSLPEYDHYGSHAWV